MYHERKERKRTRSEPYLRRKEAAPRTAGVLEEQVTLPNVKESGLYGRSLFACLQKEKSGQDPCTDLAAFWPLPASRSLIV